ncbi:hypothetical protein B0H12DRAFT_1136426 [Mycena haematopus]|nr:hypothetical protein B0H12DRAFT_1136426 [Mycena haematopus]
MCSVLYRYYSPPLITSVQGVGRGPGTSHLIFRYFAQCSYGPSSSAGFLVGGQVCQYDPEGLGTAASMSSFCVNIHTPP